MGGDWEDSDQEKIDPLQYQILSGSTLGTIYYK